MRTYGQKDIKQKQDWSPEIHILDTFNPVRKHIQLKILTFQGIIKNDIGILDIKNQRIV